MLDDSVRLMVMWKYNVYSWDMPSIVIITDIIYNY